MSLADKLTESLYSLYRSTTNPNSNIIRSYYANVCSRYMREAQKSQGSFGSIQTWIGTQIHRALESKLEFDDCFTVEFTVERQIAGKTIRGHIDLLYEFYDYTAIIDIKTCEYPPKVAYDSHIYQLNWYAYLLNRKPVDLFVFYVSKKGLRPKLVSVPYDPSLMLEIRQAYINSFSDTPDPLLPVKPNGMCKFCLVASCPYNKRKERKGK